MNVYEVRVDDITKRVNADHYAIRRSCGVRRLTFYRIVTDPNSTDKAEVVAEFNYFTYVTFEDVLLDPIPGIPYANWPELPIHNQWPIQT